MATEKLPSKPASPKTSNSEDDLLVYRLTLTQWGLWRDGMSLEEAIAVHKAERAKRDQAEEERRRLRVEAEAAEARRRMAATAQSCREALARVGIDTSGLDDAQVIERHTQERRNREEAESRRRRAEWLFRNAECPERHIRHLDGTGNAPEWTRTRDVLAARLTDGEGFLVPLLGPRGTGKTQLAVSVIHRACGLGMTARYIKALDLFRLIRGAYTPVRRGEAGEDEADLIDKLAGYGLLVIDELHQRAETAFEQNTLVNLLDRRYDAMRYTILIANQTRQEFGDAMGDSIKSRIHETGAPVECHWPSFRKPGMWAGGAS